MAAAGGDADAGGGVDQILREGTVFAYLKEKLQAPGSGSSDRLQLSDKDLRAAVGAFSADHNGHIDL